MSAQPAPSYEADNAVELSESPGRRLRALRQSRGLDLDRVAGELHLRPAQISALEQDDYGALPGPVYVVGYMRNYARLLGLDPEPLICAYRASSPRNEPPRPAQGPTGGGRAARRLTSLAILAVLAGLGYLWWENRYPDGPPAFLAAHPIAETETDPAKTGPAPAPEPPQTIPQAIPQKAATGADAASPEPVAAAPPQAADKPAAPVSAGTTAAQVAPAAPTAEQDGSLGQDAAPAAAGTEAGDAAAGTGAGTRPEILMEFTGPCWVEVRDSDRKVRISGIMQKGDRRVLEGAPPFSVKLGNAGAAKITVAGAPFDLKAVTRGSKARFTLNPD